MTILKRWAKRSAGICESSTSCGRWNCRAWSRSRSDRVARPEQLLISAIEKTVGHAGDVIANHAVERLSRGLLAEQIGEALWFLQEELEQLGDHRRGPAALAGQRMGGIDTAVQEALDLAVRG